MPLRRIVTTVLAGTALLLGAAPASAEPAAVPGGFFAGSAAEAANPGGSLPGVNDPDCTPSADHPRPVVLVHGLTLNGQTNWAPMAAALVRAGHCVYAPTVGVLPGAADWPATAVGAVADLREAARELGEAVDRVRRSTGAETVDLVSHSTGTLIAGYYAKNLGGGAHVDTLVALTPTWKGNEAYGAGMAVEAMDALGVTELTTAMWDPVCPACLQMAKGSEFMNEITDGGPYAPGVRYVNVMTRYDELVVPYTAGHVDRSDTVNIVLQDDCAQDFSEHLTVASSVRAQQIVLNALDPANARPVPCVFVPPFIG